MPYDAADAPDYKTVLWDNGKPYWRTAKGGKIFIPPMSAAQIRDDPKAMAWARAQGVNIDYQTDEAGNVTVGEGGVTNTATPGGSLFRNRGEWNSDTGDFDQSLNWGNILSMVIAGTITAGVASAAMGGGAAAEAAVSTALTTGSAEAGVAAAAPLASTALLGTGAAAALPAGIASGTSAAGLGASLAGGAAAAGGGAAASGGLAPLASTPTSMAGLTLPAGVPSGTSAALGSTGSTLGTVSRVAKAANMAGDIGERISNASGAAGNNRRDDAQFGQVAQRTYESALMDRAVLEGKQRHDADKDVYRASFFKNEKPGPYNPKTLPPVSAEYMGSLSALEQQGLERLKAPAKYDAATLKPLVEHEVEDAGTLEKVGSWVGPTLSAVSTASKYF